MGPLGRHREGLPERARLGASGRAGGSRLRLDRVLSGGGTPFCDIVLTHL